MHALTSMCVSGPYVCIGIGVYVGGAGITHALHLTAVRGHSRGDAILIVCLIDIQDASAAEMSLVENRRELLTVHAHDCIVSMVDAFGRWIVNGLRSTRSWSTM